MLLVLFFLLLLVLHLIIAVDTLSNGWSFDSYHSSAYVVWVVMKPTVVVLCSSVFVVIAALFLGL